MSRELCVACGDAPAAGECPVCRDPVCSRPECLAANGLCCLCADSRCTSCWSKVPGDANAWCKTCGQGFCGACLPAEGHCADCRSRANDPRG